MSEAVYSTIKESDTGKLIVVSVPYDLSAFATEDEMCALARQIHDDIQERVREWVERESERNLYA